MTSAEWASSPDARKMIEALWEARGVTSDEGSLYKDVRVQRSSVPEGDELRSLLSALYVYYLRCCRAIWKLLPQEYSRLGVEVAERYLAGEATADEFRYANRDAETAAFRLTYDNDSDEVQCLVEQAEAIPEAELRAMLHPPETASQIEMRELLKRAAYFADFAMVSSWISPLGPPPQSYEPFLSADLLREVISNPFDD